MGGCYKLICLILLLKGLSAAIPEQVEELKTFEKTENYGVTPRDIIVVCKDNETAAEQERLLKEISLKLDLIDIRLKHLEYDFTLLSERFSNYSETQNQKWNITTAKIVEEHGKLKEQIPQLLENALAAQTAELKGYCSAEKPKPPPPPPPKPKPLRIHKRSGKNVDVFNDGAILSRKRPLDPFDGEIFEYVAGLTNRPLNENDLLEVRLDGRVSSWAESFQIGVTLNKPEKFKYPVNMRLEKTDTWIWAQNKIFENGKKSKDSYGQNINRLDVGDRIGVRRKNDGSLHFYLNGIDQGVAAVAVPEGVHGFIELFGNMAQATIVDHKDDKEL